MYNRLRVQDFGCIRRCEVALTPLHALIGPNDSGKSTLLEALRTVLHFAAGTFVRSEEGWLPFEPRRPPFLLEIAAGDAAYSVESASVSGGLREAITATSLPTRPLVAADARPWNQLGIVHHQGQMHLHADLSALRIGEPTDGWHSFREGDGLRRNLLRGVHLVRLEPDALRRATPLGVSGATVPVFGERGLGLATILTELRDRKEDAYRKLREDFLALFATAAELSFENVPVRHANGHAGVGRSLSVILRDGTKVPAQLMSEGMIRYLAFRALLGIDTPGVLLVEEPENGLHPARIEEVMGVLREISKTTQVVLATHSPMVVNELQPHEVSVVTRDENGTHVRSIDTVPNITKRQEVYQLGELWVAYADGTTDEELFQGRGDDE